MIERFSAHWWVFALRGVAAILFGLIAVFSPEITIYVLVLIFGAYALVDGIFAIVASLRGSHSDQRWWILLMEGIASLIVGIVSFLNPNITAFVFAYLLAAWAILTGVFAIVSAVQMRAHLPDEWLWIVSGAISIAFGIAIAVLPAAGIIVWSYMIGIYAFIAGLALLGFAIRLRGHHRGNVGA